MRYFPQSLVIGKTFITSTFFRYYFNWQINYCKFSNSGYLLNLGYRYTTALGKNGNSLRRLRIEIITTMPRCWSKLSKTPRHPIMKIHVTQLQLEKQDRMIFTTHVRTKSRVRFNKISIDISTLRPLNDVSLITPPQTRLFVSFNSGRKQVFSLINQNNESQESASAFR